MIDEQFAALKGKGKGKGDKGKGAGARTRNVSKERVRFQWDNSCWHCRCKDHKRDKCAADPKLCEPTGKAPEGYVSAYHKARKVWQAAQKPKQSHVKAMTEEVNTEDEDDSDSGDEFGCALRTIGDDIESEAESVSLGIARSTVPLGIARSSVALAAMESPHPVTSQPMDPLVIGHLNAWAHKVTRSRRNKPKSATQLSPLSDIVISTAKDLDKALAKFPQLMTAMPTDRKKIMKASKKLPNRLVLGPGECWAMVDSGAGVPGI